MYDNLLLFGFDAMWSPYFLAANVLLIVVYLWFVGPGRRLFKDSTPVSLSTKTFFIVSIVLLYACKGSPVDLMGHLMFSAHMTQMAIVYLVIPPLLILGLPNWLIQSIIEAPVVRPLFQFFSKPLIALLVFNTLFSIYHIPLIFDAIKTDMTWHAVVNIVLFISAFCMWWPLMNKAPGYESLSGIKKVGYVFANGILLTPACALIIFAKTPLYATYADPQSWVQALSLCVSPDMMASIPQLGPELFNMLPLVEDQQLGGVLMKIIQEIVYGSILAYIFYQWARKERAKDEVPDPPVQPHSSHVSISPKL